MSSTNPFSIPGFEFLQQMSKSSSAAIPGLANLSALQQWATPSLDPAELDKRIDELRTVQFWLEQNAKLIGTTIQTLEVQRMTLSALQAMNVSMKGLGDAMRVTPQRPSAASAQPAATPEPKAEPKAQAKPSPSAAAQAAAGMVDPMQWWQALTTQFQQLAQQAVKSAPTAPKAAAPAASASPAPAPAARKSAPRKKRV